MLVPIVKFGEKEEVAYDKSYDLANMCNAILALCAKDSDDFSSKRDC